MRFSFVWLFVFVLVMGGVFGDENGTEEIVVEDGGSGDGKVFTAEFYVALLIGVVILALLGWVVWLVIRGPKNKWDK
ncbi:hypothetical protein K8R30_03130 [archaeon]|nr:hypothetical protein [archaeon]